MKEEPYTGQKLKKAAPKTQLSENKRKISSKPKVNEKFCFIITKNNTNSWADDLYACGRISDLNRVYH